MLPIMEPWLNLKLLIHQAIQNKLDQAPKEVLEQAQRLHDRSRPLFRVPLQQSPPKPEKLP